MLSVRAKDLTPTRPLCLYGREQKRMCVVFSGEPKLELKFTL